MNEIDLILAPKHHNGTESLCSDPVVNITSYYSSELYQGLIAHLSNSLISSFFHPVITTGFICSFHTPYL
jgi:membrane-bound lytic murein transglycosylase B